MNNFLVQKFFKRCVFTWIIPSTLGSKCILAANNFSLITMFFFRILLFTAKHTVKFVRFATKTSLLVSFLSFLLFSIQSIDEGKLFGQPALEFLNFIGEKQSVERSLHDWLSMRAYGIEQRKKHHVHRTLLACREKTSYCIYRIGGHRPSIIVCLHVIEQAWEIYPKKIQYERSNI